MADTSAATGLTVQQWDRKYFTEALNAHVFKPFMGTGTNSLIQVKEDLTKKPGDSVTYSLINSLAASAVEDGAVLEGSEEAMDQRSHKITMHQYRNGVRVPAYDDQITAIPLRNAAKDVLMNWSMELWRDRCITVLGNPGHLSANATLRNAWLVDNNPGGVYERTLFGDSVTNGSYAVHATDLATVTAGMTLTTDILSLMKRMAKTASPKIRPLKDRSGSMTSDQYVIFADSLSVRDLASQTAFQTANREARNRGITNPLFKGADYIWDNMAIYEVEDIASLGAVGASSATVSPVYLCGAQALGHAWAKRPKSVTETFDYGDKFGVAVEQWYGIEKLIFGAGSGDTDDPKDHGVVTAYVAAAGDA
tara:strand:+ start:4450 stop:5544 length:1095 start_codon:yes stop_codon:yes gene_type:complete